MRLVIVSCLCERGYFWEGLKNETVVWDQNVRSIKSPAPTYCCRHLWDSAALVGGWMIPYLHLAPRQSRVNTSITSLSGPPLTITGVYNKQNHQRMVQYNGARRKMKVMKKYSNTNKCSSAPRTWHEPIFLVQGLSDWGRQVVNGACSVWSEWVGVRWGTHMHTHTRTHWHIHRETRSSKLHSPLPVVIVTSSMG